MSKASMIPKEIARELKQLSLKDHRRSPHRSSSSSTTSCRPILANTSNITDDEVAVFDDLESPQMLATSAGAGNGEMLHSLSTISLLSLSREQLESHSNSSNLNNHNTPDRKQRHSISRNSSFSHSRVSSFHQQRHPSAVNFYTPQQQRRSSTQTQPINITTDFASPTTPSLGPTSLTNSPSHFHLGNQQLPASLQSSRGHGFPGLTRNNSSQSTLQLQTPQIMAGSMSPFLDPVGGDVPMTPLTLSPLNE